MTEVASVDVRNRLADILNRVALRKERVIITRHGREVAAVVPLEDVRRLESGEGQAGETGRPDTASIIRAVKGRFAHVPTSSEAYAATKRDESAKEERRHAGRA